MMGGQRGSAGRLVVGLVVLLLVAAADGFGMGSVSVGIRRTSVRRTVSEQRIRVAAQLMPGMEAPMAEGEREEDPRGPRECLDDDVKKLKEVGSWDLSEEHDAFWAQTPRTIFSRVGLQRGTDKRELFHRGPEAMKALYHWSDLVTLVYFKKQGCSICRVFQPILERVVKEYEATESFNFVDVEVLENPIITKSAQLTSVPAICVYHEGILIEEVKGAHCKKYMRRILDAITASKGATATARQWGKDRQDAAQMEEYMTSARYKASARAQQEHAQQFAPAWRVSQSPAAGGFAAEEVWAVRAGGDGVVQRGGGPGGLPQAPPGVPLAAGDAVVGQAHCRAKRLKGEVSMLEFLLVYPGLA
eukprot:CAMPEP_0173392398 /NCGR_PEP_ID=MMETSP1356-20130122/19439_1 /TAXON_ID=77927 ORGANISM="Hemiselmis virescens, Strain PCC157" /NCGR_SAMPLE_ID=MMETSP1356 /ASSEMBLY_ACC=CAM_ASM_000847 /LENGTH=359 /DNA_ID=CAMNT_0014350183 /DNA_START=290 /DNA_END=1368 /DNA_ORIENTATION=-